MLWDWIRREKTAPLPEPKTKYYPDVSQVERKIDELIKAVNANTLALRKLAGLPDE
jgi:hypothetical protein